MLRDAGDADLAGRCTEAAKGLKAAYLPCFFDPVTGWLGGRRRDSRDMHGIYCNGSASTSWMEYYI